MDPKKNAFDDALTRALKGLEISMGADELARYRAHFELVVQANRVTNLTRITEPATAAVKHYADSLALLRWIDERVIEIETVLDVGTGAGYPAVPLAIARPDWTVTAIDATAKKIEFLESAAAALKLTNLRCEHAHSRHWKPGRTFDLLVARAVTALPQTLKHAAAHVSRGGWLVAYKTASIDLREEQDAERVSSRLGLRLHDRHAYTLDCGDETLKRALLIYRKTV